MERENRVVKPVKLIPVEPPMPSPVTNLEPCLESFTPSVSSQHKELNWSRVFVGCASQEEIADPVVNECHDAGFADFEADTADISAVLSSAWGAGDDRIIRGDSSNKKVKVEEEVEQEVESDVEKSAASVKQHIDVTSTDMVTTSIDMAATSIDMAASNSNSTCVAKPEKLDYDELPKEMNEMKIKEATIVNGNVTEKGQQ
ncbi:hypothetical protein R6Q57_000962 [Mikania cordata]